MHKRFLLSLVVAGFTLAGCQGKNDSSDQQTADDNDDSSEMTTGDGAQADGQPGQGQGQDGAAADTEDDPDDDTADESGDEATFLPVNPDGGVGNVECDVFAQDCPNGEKCAAWSPDGSPISTATRCVDIVDNPGEPGDECTVEGNAGTGIDDCRLGAMCWNVDGETNIGTCVDLCTGSADSPLCENPSTSCVIVNDGVLNVCLSNCDPLLQDCPDGEACYLMPGLEFNCAPDFSGESGDFGEPCGAINDCNPGLVCADASVVPSCTASDCCSEFCVVDDPTGDDQCSGATGGQQCLPLYEEGAAPPGGEDIGVCAIPN